MFLAAWISPVMGLPTVSNRGREWIATMRWSLDRLLAQSRRGILSIPRIIGITRHATRVVRGGLALQKGAHCSTSLRGYSLTVKQVDARRGARLHHSSAPSSCVPDCQLPRVENLVTIQDRSAQELFNRRADLLIPYVWDSLVIGQRE
jgi:hypothetical protein